MQVCRCFKQCDPRLAHRVDTPLKTPETRQDYFFADGDSVGSDTTTRLIAER